MESNRTMWGSVKTSTNEKVMQISNEQLRKVTKLKMLKHTFCQSSILHIGARRGFGKKGENKMVRWTKHWAKDQVGIEVLCFFKSLEADI